MKARIYSDIHLDWFFANGMPINKTTGEMHCWKPPVMPDDHETTLIIAGDLWVGTRFIEFAGYSWIKEVAARFKQVLIVLGNHDYWPGNNALTITKGGETCNAMLQDMGILNVKVLDCDTYQDGNILFIGATMWTDMDKCDPLVMQSMSNIMSYDGKIAYETGPGGQWSRFTSEKWVKEHSRHKGYISHVLSQNRDKECVVITHHMPVETLIDPRYRGQMSNAYYASDCSNMLLDNDNLTMWIYGHSHHQKQVMFPEWAGDDGVLMYNNAVGYISEHQEQLGAVKHEVILIGE